MWHETKSTCLLSFDTWKFKENNNKIWFQIMPEKFSVGILWIFPQFFGLPLFDSNLNFHTKNNPEIDETVKKLSKKRRIYFLKKNHPKKVENVNNWNWKLEKIRKKRKNWKREKHTPKKNVQKNWKCEKT